MTTVGNRDGIFLVAAEDRLWTKNTKAMTPNRRNNRVSKLTNHRILTKDV